MTISPKSHHPTNLMRCAARPPERYGDVELSVQASRFHGSGPRNGCGHTPLELYDRVEVALRWASTRARDRWIRQPSRELGIDGFDDLWREEGVAIADYVPRERVDALRAALVERTRSQDGLSAARETAVAPDRGPAVEEVGVDADEIDVPPPATNAQRDLELA
jgi:hypothetical protein